MKKLLSVVLILLLLIPSAIAEELDLSKYTFGQLVMLRNLCQMEMMKRDEWQEVTVPVGVWKIGEDIPAGHWNITASKESAYGWGSIEYCDKLDITKKEPDRHNVSIYYHAQVKYPGSNASVEATSIDLELEEGMYLIIEYSAMVFTPYTGKPNLGFK